MYNLFVTLQSMKLLLRTLQNHVCQNPNEDFPNPNVDFENPHWDFPVAPGGYHHLGKRISQTQKGKSPLFAEIAAAAWVPLQRGAIWVQLFFKFYRSSE
mgnify:CR=1 FL=1